jgi:hypothetical protein
MKKFFTILVAIASVTVASAQSKRDIHDAGNSRSVVYNQPKDDHRDNNSSYGAGSFSTRERDAQIQSINRQFDMKIADVQRNRRMRSSEKSRQIRMLEQQRSIQIRECQEHFSSSRDQYSSHAQYRKY